MSGNQRTEWKESWRDEHLKHLCAFANAQGGSLFIGVKKEYLDKLKKKGILRRVGPDKGGHWEVIKK